jgi:hypothetical protein
VAKLVWRAKLVAELEPGLATEWELARLERAEQAGLADFGLRLAEVKQLTAALQAEMVPGAGGQRRGAPVRHRSMGLVLAAVLGYSILGWFGEAPTAFVGAGVRTTIRLFS